jgi:hypothetical protein
LGPKKTEKKRRPIIAGVGEEGEWNLATTTGALYCLW